jgi:hypothetical protein
VALWLRRYGGSLERSCHDFAMKRNSIVTHLSRSRSGSPVQEVWWLVGNEFSWLFDKEVQYGDSFIQES